MRSRLDLRIEPKCELVINGKITVTDRVT